MPGDAEQSDPELISQSATGNRDAFAELVERHEAAVFRYARTIASDDSAAEDALQEAFLGAWRGAAGFQGRSTVRSWLFTIVRNAVYRQHRRRVEEPEMMESLTDLGVAAGWGDPENPEDIALRNESRDAMKRAMESLGDRDREILLLRDIEGLSGEEVAELLGLPLAAMKTRLHRARLRLAANVRKAYEHTR